MKLIKTCLQSFMVLEEPIQIHLTQWPKIIFSIPIEDDVLITVHDFQGREVVKLLNGIFLGGRHVVSWNAINVSSGNYFLKFQPSDHAETKNIILL